MRGLLLVAASICLTLSAQSQQRHLDTPVFMQSIESASHIEPASPLFTSEEYDIEMGRLPKLSVFRDSQEGLESIVREFPTARQINILDANGDPVYRYLPSLLSTKIEVPTWPKGLYYVELFLEQEKVISDKRIFIL